MQQEYSAGKKAAIQMGKTERSLSAVGGSLLLYHVAKKHKGDTLLWLGGAYLIYRAVTGHCPVAQAFRNGQTHDHTSNINVRTSVVVNRPRKEVYAFWRRLENLPLFMTHLESVDEIDRMTSAWKVRVPGGLGDVRWEATIVREEEGAELSWHSVPGATIENTGKVNFSDTPGKGTRIDALVSYKAPMGVIGERISRLLTPLFRDVIEQDIKGFKHFMENLAVGGD